MGLLQVVLSASSLISSTWAVDKILIQSKAVPHMLPSADGTWTSFFHQSNAMRKGLEVEAVDLFRGNDTVMKQFMEAMASAREATRLAGEELKHDGPVSFVDGDGGPQQHVMYGVFTTAVPAYRKRLEAVMTTWGARPKSNGLFYSVGGHTYPSEWQEPGVVVGAEDCDDGVYGNSCKEASLIAEAARRNASWLVISGEDNYVDTARVETALRAMDPIVPVAMGCLGCGTGLAVYGELVARDGGMCGGCGEVLSHGALQMLAARGRSALIEEYGTETQCDMVTSRALRERSIPLKSFPGQLVGNPIFSQKEIEQATGVMIFHYVMPGTMRWLHALRTGSAEEQDEELPSLAVAAFKEGCARGFKGNIWFAPRVKDCREKFLKSA